MQNTKQIFFALLLVSFVAGLSFGQSVPKGMMLPKPADEYLEEPDTKVPLIYIGFGFKNGNKSDSLTLFLEGKTYPVWALGDYIERKKATLTPIEVYKTVFMMQIDERIPFADISELITEARFQGVNRVGWMFENGKTLLEVLPGLSNDEAVFYQKQKSLKIPKGQQEWTFPFEENSVQTDETSIPAPMPGRALPPPPPPPAPGSGRINPNGPSGQAQIVHLEKNGTISFNEKKIKPEMLTSECMEALEKYQPSAFFIFKIDEQVNFKDYISTFSKMRAAYFKKWDEEAVNSFQKNMNQLKFSESIKVKNKYPYVIQTIGSFEMAFENSKK